MTNKLALLKAILFLITVFLLVSNSQAQYKLNEGPIHISGLIRNLDKGPDEKIVTFTFMDLLGLTQKKTSQIKPDGSFEIEHRIIGTQDFTIHYGNSIKLIAVPGDTIEIDINAALIDTSETLSKNKNGFLEITKGKALIENNLIAPFLSEITISEDPEKSQQAIKELLPEQYKKYTLDKKNRKLRQLSSFQNKHKITALFSKWALDYINFEARDLLMRYRWEHPMLNDIPKASFNLPKNYFSFLKDFNNDSPEIISSPHANFLHELYRHKRDDIPKDSIVKLSVLRKEKNYFDYINMQVGYLQRGSKQFIRDLFLTKYFYNILQGNTAIEFEQTFYPSLISKQYFRNILNTKHEEVLNFLANQETGKGATISKIDDSVTKNLLDSLLNRYKNKVIYIDFWAPWCSPCLNEMPNMKELQSECKDKDILFLFLANRCSFATWKATIAHHQINGEHLLLTNDQFNILSSTFHISGIPHYVLIDKKGRLAMENAPAPSDKESILTEIKKLLQ